ncbi:MULTISPECIES: single-stranded DNA-binding protein [Protofrankia]|uniref:Single-stranded DNA-binding protein n=1 Tax=Candidatus Protofrankia datiscae TaxID=2716812 RepID=F8B2W0_9ACTN|nr:MULTISPECIES: single-stranded DNA-binding protein [Protofrankia]AEH08942.1 single-strand binding protein [Candidatus Protofrankia datiscae]
MIEASVTLLGNLVDDPELRCTQNGNFVCSLRLASTARRFDRTQNRWVDGASVFITVTCWRHMAENVSASLRKGDRTLVVGRLRQRSFETHEGNRRVVYEVDADAVAVDLARQTAEVRRVVRASGENGSGQAAEGAAPAGESVGTHDGAGGPAGEGRTHLDTGTEYRDANRTDGAAEESFGESLPGVTMSAAELADISPSVTALDPAAA